MTTHHTSRTTPILLGLGLAFTTAACGDDGGDGDINEPGELTISELSGTFAGPESAHWDSAGNVWYVANFGQNLDLSGGTPDQPGYISKLNADGTVMEERFFETDGDLLGLAVLDGKLYVSHASDVLEIDTATGTSTTIAIPNPGFVNDVAVGNGAVYISDTGTNTIYRLTPGGTPEVFSTDSQLVAPNGVYVDGDTVIVATLGSFPPDPANPGAIYSLDSQGVATQLGTLTGAFDGVEKLGDRYVVSDFNGKIYYVDDSDGSSELIVDAAQAPNSFASTADIGFDPATKRMLVPDLAGNKAYLFTLP